MSWIQVSFIAERDQVPLIEAALESVGALALTLRDAADESLIEPPPDATPLWGLVSVSALFADAPRTLTTVRALSLSLAAHLSAQPRTEHIQDKIWERVWLDDFAPARFGRRLWVCPRGQAPQDPNAVIVELDPGLAFGTGHHPTTALCLRWLDGADLGGTTLIDYGCGSGILAIAALRLGAARAVAVDHDPQALEATRSNAANNAVADRLLACLPESLPEQPYDLMLANILAGPLVELAPRFAALVRPDGPIALSGILHDQAEQVQDAYTPWFEMEMPRMEGEWMLLSGCRRPSI